jgi:hypothetical protein
LWGSFSRQFALWVVTRQIVFASVSLSVSINIIMIAEPTGDGAWRTRGFNWLPITNIGSFII